MRVSILTRLGGRVQRPGNRPVESGKQVSILTRLGGRMQRVAVV